MNRPAKRAYLKNLLKEQAAPLRKLQLFQNGDVVTKV